MGGGDCGGGVGGGVDCGGDCGGEDCGEDCGGDCGEALADRPTPRSIGNRAMTPVNRYRRRVRILTPTGEAVAVLVAIFVGIFVAAACGGGLQLLADWLS